ncbi:MAG: hypothetical protein RH945_13360 [Hyphomonas sp.]|tara:strand:+ start:6785 stop:7099 length:315 start_codon:yes stop_codon:yes gene_type:complete
MVSSSNLIPIEKIWNIVVSHLRHGAHDFSIWTSRLSDAERVVGLCLFVLVLMCLMIRPRRKPKREVKTGPQFTYALIIIMIFSFGIGMAFDSSLNIDLLMRKLF